jgi:hypothetical protein
MMINNNNNNNTIIIIITEKHKIKELQKTATLVTAQMLRKMLM